MSTSRLPEWAEPLGLTPHPEGGWFRETYRSRTTIPASALPRHADERSSATMVHFLLLPDEQSAWHRVRSDELWLYLRGGRLSLELGGSDAEPGEVTTIELGPDVASGQELQGLVPADVWQRARPLDDEAVLVACMVTPGFDFTDFTLLDGQPPAA